jgi:Tol biopolymer transport system component
MPAEARPLGMNGQIAYGNNAGMVTANPDGSGARLLVPNVGGAGWSYDGNKLAMGYGTSDGRIGTAIINPDGTGYTEFAIPNPTLNIGCSIWAPNDKRLVCEGWNDANPVQDGLYTISSTDGGALRRVTKNPLGGHDIPGSYSPNGKRIVFGRFDQNGNSAGLFTVRTNGKRLRQLVPANTILNVGGGDWSPRGNEIIFSQHLTPDVHGSLWAVRANGKGLHEINIPGLPCGGPNSDPNAFGCHAPYWSPDGTKIIFAANSQATGVNIYEANVDGSNLIQVTHDGQDDGPTWGTHPPTG